MIRGKTISYASNEKRKKLIKESELGGKVEKPVSTRNGGIKK